MDKLHEWWGEIVVAIFMWSADRVFPIKWIWIEEGKSEPTAVFFAESDRDMNCAMRDYLDDLDSKYKT